MSCTPALTLIPSPHSRAGHRRGARGEEGQRPTGSGGRARPAAGAPGLAPIEDPLHLGELPGRDVPLQARLQRFQRSRHGGGRAQPLKRSAGPWTLSRAAPSGTPRSPHGVWRHGPALPSGRGCAMAEPCRSPARALPEPCRSFGRALPEPWPSPACSGKGQKSGSPQKVTWRGNLLCWSLT